MFVVARTIGGLLGLGLIRNLSPVEAVTVARVVVPHEPTIERN
jgi:hypothetical protein